MGTKPKISSSSESGNVPLELLAFPVILLLLFATSFYFLYPFSSPSTLVSTPIAEIPLNDPSPCLTLDMKGSKGVQLKEEHCLPKHAIGGGGSGQGQAGVMGGREGLTGMKKVGRFIRSTLR